MGSFTLNNKQTCKLTTNDQNKKQGKYVDEIKNDVNGLVRMLH